MKKKAVLRESLYSLLFYNTFFKKIGIKLLNSPRFVNNFFYQFVFNRYIQSVILKYRKAPNTVVVENTNFCNSACVFCPHSVMKRKQGVMDKKLFRKIVDECVSLGVSHLSIHNFGEPLMDKDFMNKVRYAKKKGLFWVGTSTNGKLLTKSLSEEIILSGLDGINFSLDAFSKTAYEKIRIGLPFEKVIENVKQFIELRHKLKKDNPMIVVDFVENEFNKNEIKKFVAEWRNLADKVNISTLHTWGGIYGGKAGKESFHFENLRVKKEPCRFLWTDMVINWDGRVSACCQDYEAKMVIGDVATQSLKDIWQGEVLNKLREKHLSGKMTDIPLCSKCDYRSVWWLFK